MLILLSIYTITITVDNAVNTDNTFNTDDDSVSFCTTLPLPQGPVLPFILCILLVLILLSIHTITITVDNAVNTDNTFCIVDDTVSIISILVATKPPVPPLLIVQLAVQTRFKFFLEILGDTKRYLVQFGSS